MQKIKSLYERLKNYCERTKNLIYDPAVDINDRAFLLFSVLVLFALFIAIPCGLIMREPILATISTLVGALVFSAYVYYSYKKNRIERAKVVLSIIVVVVFLPAMFFTNGGVYGGAPIWLLLGTIYIALILKGKFKKIMIIINALMMIACWLVGYFFPDLVTEYSRGGNYFDSIAAFFIVGAIIYHLIDFQMSLYLKEEENKNLLRLFEQTAIALVNAIEAKDEYTRGHSKRVARYSRMIAQQCGKSPAECKEIYYIAFLHDVGKIGIPENIINKNGKLTDEEYKIMKEHPILGAQILSSITEYPQLLVGAKWHHERYDGRGYPDKLKGEDIPEIARIISVADAYDAMTSYRSYRETIPQQSVREEIVKGSGTQFDPKFAKIMQHIIDMDIEYDMREKGNAKEMVGKYEIVSNEFYDEMSEGMLLGKEIKKITFKCDAADRSSDFTPAIILYDSLDGRYHDTVREIKELNYFEFARLAFDGENECKGARKIAVEERPSRRSDTGSGNKKNRSYEIEAVKIRDHVMITIDDHVKAVRITVALPDSTRYSYMGFTGKNTHLYDMNISAGETVADAYIPRIAEEVSFIDGPEGDIPSIQIDGYRTASTLGIPVRDGMKITFRSKSLPTARLVWHCAYFDLFWSPTKMPEGEGYREYALIRLDGENWEAEGIAQNKLIVNIGDDFCGWDEWKDENKKGYYCTVRFRVEGNVITTTTDNLGITLKNITTILDDPEEVYVSLTGDQTVLTDIRVTTKQPEQDKD